MIKTIGILWGFVCAGIHIPWFFVMVITLVIPPYHCKFGITETRKASEDLEEIKSKNIDNIIGEYHLCQVGKENLFISNEDLKEILCLAKIL